MISGEYNNLIPQKRKCLFFVHITPNLQSLKVQNDPNKADLSCTTIEELQRRNCCSIIEMPGYIYFQSNNLQYC